METFQQVFGFVAAICAGIVILALFFTVLSRFNGAARGFSVVKWKGFIKDGKLVNVHVDDGKSFERLRFIGFTDQTASGRGFSYQLAGMVVLETAAGARVFIKADSVRMIEEIGSSGQSNSRKLNSAPPHPRVGKCVDRSQSDR